MAEGTKAVSLSMAWADLFDNQEDCDVMFSADGKTIGAHKLVLKAMRGKCEELLKMSSGWNMGDVPIAFGDLDFVSFKALLRYVYTDEITISNKNVFPILSAAVQFNMSHLEQLCVNHISKSLRTNNVCHYMNEAVDFKSTILKEKCQEIFSKNTIGILEYHHQSFLQLSQPALSALLDTENTNIPEVDIFLYVKRWMNKRCSDLHLPVNGTNMRKVIGDAVYKIRFPTMNVQDFANQVAAIEGFLTDTETAQIFKKITLFNNKDIECPFSDSFHCIDNQRFTDMAQLLDQDVLYNHHTGQKCSLMSMMKDIKDTPSDCYIDTSPFLLVMQCCADLANSSILWSEATADNQEIRNELFNDFVAWDNIRKTEDLHNTMTKFMQFRSKFDKIHLNSYN